MTSLAKAGLVLLLATFTCGENENTAAETAAEAPSFNPNMITPYDKGLIEKATSLTPEEGEIVETFFVKCCYEQEHKKWIHRCNAIRKRLDEFKGLDQKLILVMRDQPCEDGSNSSDSSRSHSGHRHKSSSSSSPSSSSSSSSTKSSSSGIKSSPAQCNADNGACNNTPNVSGPNNNIPPAPPM